MTTPRNSRRAEIKPVPSVEPDRTRCRAVVLSSGATQQCSRRPAATRQYRDGKLYPVCQQHKRAQWFEPWTARLLIDPLDLVRAAQRALPPLGRRSPPPKPKLVR